MTCVLYGWLLGLTYPNKRSLSTPQVMSFEIPHSQRPTPRMSDSYQSGIQVYNFLVILFLSLISEVGQVVPSLLLMINYPGVASYMHENEFASHTRLLPLLSN